MKYLITEIDPSNGDERVVDEFADLNSAMKASTKLRGLLPPDWCVQIYEKPYYLRMRKYLKKRDKDSGKS